MTSACSRDTKAIASAPFVAVCTSKPCALRIRSTLRRKRGRRRRRSRGSGRRPPSRGRCARLRGRRTRSGFRALTSSAPSVLQPLPQPETVGAGISLVGARLATPSQYSLKCSSRHSSAPFHTASRRSACSPILPARNFDAVRTWAPSPAHLLLEHVAELRVQRAELAQIAEPLAVGRVGHQRQPGGSRRGSSPSFARRTATTSSTPAPRSAAAVARTAASEMSEPRIGTPLEVADSTPAPPPSGCSTGAGRTTGGARARTACRGARAPRSSRSARPRPGSSRSRTSGRRAAPRPSSR